jgi:hypothetical protein
MAIRYYSFLDEPSTEIRLLKYAGENIGFVNQAMKSTVPPYRRSPSTTDVSLALWEEGEMYSSIVEIYVHKMMDCEERREWRDTSRSLVMRRALIY